MPSLQEQLHQSSVHEPKEYGKPPRYSAQVYKKPEKVDDMYCLLGTGFNGTDDIQKRIEKVLGPLSLFAPFSHEDVPVLPTLELERPVTPVDEEIRVMPSTMDKMAFYVRRRITPQADVPYLSTEDQKTLAAIIVGEVNAIWPDIRHQIDDPFLSPEENKELNRRIAVHIVTVCQQLFNHYLSKAQVLNSRGVFSGPANMSRLRTQLALETSELLNILKIRRYIVNDIKTSRPGVDVENDDTVTWPQQDPVKSKQKLTYQAMLDMSRPRSRPLFPGLNSVDQAVKEIKESFPVLDMSRLMDLIGQLPERTLNSPGEKGVSTRKLAGSSDSSLLSGVTKEDVSKKKIIYRRSKSQPKLDQGESLLEELGIAASVRRDRLIEQELAFLQRERQYMNKVKLTSGMSRTLGPSLIEDDLNKLTQLQDELPDEDDDLPPLIQAITRHARHDDLKVRMEARMKELDDNQRIREEQECVYVQLPAYPQPDTVNANFGRSGPVRTSDVRVSERVCMSSVTLKKHATVYNDLLEEIDATTVKNLDKKLFLSSEIQEVYEELMKTVPASHMELDDLSYKDPLVLNASDVINITGTTASCTLSRKVIDRVINPTFRNGNGPPWGDNAMRDWAKTPTNPPKNFLGQDLFTPIVPDLSKVHETINNPSQTTQMILSADGIPSYVADKTSSTYASWLHWWKSTVTTDDYMKYLSTLETDYMGAIFHFYDSEDESESDQEYVTYKMRRSKKTLSSDQEYVTYKMRRSKKTLSSGKTKVSPEQREKLKKLEELKSVKSEYKPGFWNPNSVLMGGLGQDPDLIEEAIENEAKNSVKSENLLKIPDRASHYRPLSEKRHLHSRLSKAKADTSGQATSENNNEGKQQADAQDRLENVWQKLHVPDSQRLDMAIKYSCNEYFNKLSEAIEGWEFVSELILQREKLLVHLEQFERHASDPNRFFHKDSKKSSNRLKESKQRAHLYKRIDALDSDIKEEVDYIRNKFHDVITFKGRPYVDKMKWDRTEMLYWLSEERKQNGLKYEIYTKGINQPLEPLLLKPILLGKT